MAQPKSDNRPAAARVQNLPKQPPHSIEAEQSVLGGLLLKNDAFFEICDKISARDFYRADHQTIFEAIAELIGKNEKCDFLTATEWLRARDRLEQVGGAAYVGMLSAESYSIANIVSYAEIIHERAVQRGLIAAGGEIADSAYRPDGRSSEELLDIADRQIIALRRQTEKTETRSMAQLVVAVSNRIDEAKKRKPGEYAGMATGFLELDRRTNGLEPGDMVVVAARPGMGKTVLAMNISEYIAIVKRMPVGFISTEMTDEQLAMRVHASFSRVPLGALRSGQLNDADIERVVRAQGILNDAPLHIECRTGLTPLELRARARRMKTKHGIKLLVVDYLQRMTVPGSRENTTNDVRVISNTIKDLAINLQIPIIVLSQLSRGTEDRPNKRPRLTDLRDSGSIEQDADIVTFIYREAYYDETKDKRKAEIDIAKQRSGPTGHFELSYFGEYCKFDNPADPSLAE